MIDQEINSRVDAYRGNPEALQQKYAVSQQLIDLLALQKIKSEMDAKSRDMQLKMAQTGKKPPIAQQLQQEVVGRTKQEMQQQLAGTMQQENMEKQKALQQVVQNQEQGVAGLPANNMMPPKAMAAGGIIDFSDEPDPDYEGGMASGGIVAFDKGGNVWDKKKTPYDELIVQEARRRGIDPVVLKRLIGSESSFNPQAVSPRGEKYGVGIAQIADVHNMSKEDRLNPNKAIPAAAELFAQYLKRADGDYEKALQMYKGASSEGGKQRMSGPIRRILEGVANVAVPSAYAGDKNAPAEQKTSSPIGRFVDDVGSGKVGRDISESVGKATRAIDEAISPQGARERYDTQQRNLQQQRAQAAKLFEQEGGGFKQQTPQQQAEADKTRSEYYKSISQNGAPQPPVSNVYPEEFTRGTAATVPANPPAPEVAPETAPPVSEAPPAPAPAPQAAGIASIVPSEYKDLAKQQTKVLGDRLGIDPEEMARQRGIEYYQNIGVPTERAAADKSKRQAGLEALDAERVKHDRENELTEALVNARGSTWQGGLGSFGRNALETRRRNADLQRQFMDEANKAKDALSNIGLGVKQGVYDAKTGARKEYEGRQDKALTESGLAVGRGMQAETQREVSATAADYNKLWRQAQIDAQNARTELDRRQGIQAAKDRALTMLNYEKETIKNLEKSANLFYTSNQQPPESLLRQIELKRKELKLQELDIMEQHDALLYGKGSGLPTGIKSITPVSQ